MAKTDADTAAKIPNLAEIVAFRNLLIHGYAAVENERVWRIIQEFLPELRSKVSALIAPEA